MASAFSQARFTDPVTKHMHQDFARLPIGHTVGEALEGLRRHPPRGRIIYFYVVDAEDRLQGVVPTRVLLLNPPDKPIAEIMVRGVIALPAEATVLEACEFFIRHRLLAFPVLGGLLVARWLEFRGGNPQTSTCEPATPADLRHYVLGTIVLGFGAWVVANLIGNHWLTR